jgi:asparagine synthase (glutamine-hydrolysing)
MGFSVPLARWFRGPIKQRVSEAVLGPRMQETGFFNPQYLKELLSAHASGVRDYSSPLWALLMFDAFLGNVVQEEKPRVREKVAG